MEEFRTFISKFNPLDGSSLFPINSLLSEKTEQLIFQNVFETPFNNCEVFVHFLHFQQLLERLDWFFTSNGWTLSYPHSSVTSMIMEIADHTPCVINIATYIPKGDKDMTPSDTTIDYMVSSLLPLHSDLWYNSLGSTCTCHYLIVGTNVKLNFQFVGRPIVNHCGGHNSVIRSAIEVHELLMEILFDNLSNRSGSILVSRQKVLQFIKTFCRCFCWNYGLGPFILINAIKEFKAHY